MNTSQLAHENYKPKISSDHDLILSVLDKKEALTYKEIGYKVYKKLLLSPDVEKQKQSFAWKYDPNKVSRRLKELVVSEEIKVLEQRKCTRAKSLCNSYVRV